MGFRCHREGGALWWDGCPCKSHEAAYFPSWSLPGGDTERRSRLPPRRQPSQEAGGLSSYSQPPDLEDITSRCLYTTLSVAFLQSQPQATKEILTSFGQNKLHLRGGEDHQQLLRWQALERLFPGP